MLTIYLCFLAGGAVLPLFSSIIGSFTHGADTDIDTDVGLGHNMDIHSGLDGNVGLHGGAHGDIHGDFHGDVHGDIHGDIHGHPGADLHTDVGPVSWFSLGLIPTSFLSISSLAIIFGTVGSIMTLAGSGKAITLVIAVVSGYLASVIVQSTIKSLRKVQTENYSTDEKELMLYDGKVVETILPGQLGTVSFVTLKNVRVSYPARCIDKELKLDTGKIVKVIEFKDGVFIVEPKYKYE